MELCKFCNLIYTNAKTFVNMRGIIKLIGTIRNRERMIRDINVHVYLPMEVIRNIFLK